MAIISIEDVLTYLPDLFETDIKGEINIFDKLSNMLSFDSAYIYYANPDSLQLKYVSDTSNIRNIDSVYPISFNDKKFVFSKSAKICTSSSNLIKKLNISNEYINSYIIAKLSIKSTVFGIMILCKKEKNFYCDEDIKVINAAASILSYIIKDNELSEVFKIQLKALKEGIVEKNNAYKVIKEQNEKILEADKAKNEFLANVSHELRTPLNSILGFAEILGTKLYGDINEKQKEYIDDIKVSGTHLLGMINEILDMSKIEANAVKIVKSKFYISRAVDEASNIIMPLASKKGIKIKKIMHKDFEVFADYQKIQQILYNLLSNAVKYSPENDDIDITVFKGNDNFKIAVHDNGIGIDKKYHGKIFAKFVQLDSAYTKKESSTGLGLTITKELVELHNGKITLISEVNNGSTFIVEIPQ